MPRSCARRRSGAPLDDAARAQWHDYVYLRDNPAGPHRELWQHVSGCRAWLVVTRDTRTHEIARSSRARRALARVRSHGDAREPRA